MSIRNNFNQWNSVPIQISTAIPGTQQVPVVQRTKKLRVRIEIEPVHIEKIQKLSSAAWKELCYFIGTNFYSIISRNKTISIEKAIIINKVAGDKIFNINEEDVQKYSTPLSDLPPGPQRKSKGRKRQLSASSENPAALRSKKQRTNADDQQTTIDINAPYHHQIPVYYVNQDPSHEIPATTTPQEPIILPEMTVVSEEFNSTFDSNAANESKSSLEPPFGRKRQLSASSENPAVLRSKKQRTNADDQRTTIDANAPYHHQIPVYYVNQDPSHEIPATTTPQEPIILPEMTVVSEEFNSTFDSNAANESKSSLEPSFSLSDSSEVFKGFEFDELNNDAMEAFWNSENPLLDWNQWNSNFNQ